MSKAYASDNPRRSSSTYNGREVKNVVSAADHAAMREHYSFLPSETITKSKNKSNNCNDDSDDSDDSNRQERHTSSEGSWQERMVTKYHEHLFKDFALADLSVPGRIGLRWRTREEVVSGRGDRTCGNKRCRNNSGDNHNLVTLEVPFSYYERGERKKELVKLKLCASCRPLIATATTGTATNKTTKTSKSSTGKEAEHDVDSCSHSVERNRKRERKNKNSKRRERKEKKAKK